MLPVFPGFDEGDLFAWSHPATFICARSPPVAQSDRVDICLKHRAGGSLLRPVNPEAGIPHTAKTSKYSKH